MNNTMKIGLMPLLVFTVIAIGLFEISIAPTVEVFAGKKDVLVRLREVLLVSVGKTVLKNVVTGIQDVDR